MLGSGEINAQIHMSKEDLKNLGYLAVWDKNHRKYRLCADPLAPQAIEILQRLNELDNDSLNSSSALNDILAKKTPRPSAHRRVTAIIHQSCGPGISSWPFCLK